MSREGDIKLVEEEIRGTKGEGQAIANSWQTYNQTCQKEITAALKKAGVYDQILALETRRNKRRAEAEARLAPINEKLKQLNGTLAFLNQREAEEKSTPINKDVSLEDAPPADSADPADAPDPPAQG